MSKSVLLVLRLALASALTFTLYVAFAPSPDAPELPGWDKAAHFAAFFTLAILSALSLPRVSLLIIGVSLSLLGAAIEIIQGLPAVNRDCDVFDWFVDTIAVAAALWPALLRVARARLGEPEAAEPQISRRR